MHKDEINGEAMQPGGEGRLAAKAADLAEQVQEGFLGHVLGFGDIAQHAQAKGVHAALVKRVKLGKRFGITCLRALDRFSFAGNRWISFKEAGTRLDFSHS